MKTIPMLVLFTVLNSPLFGAGGSGWLPDYEDQLGLKVEKVPAVDESFVILEGTVTDPSKLAGLGIRGLQSGDPVTIRFAGNVKWNTEIDGKRISPCKLRLRAITKSRLVTFVPDEKTLQLKLAPPPPYRSSMQKKPQ